MIRRAVIFDLDGTLWDSSKQVVPAWNIVLGRYPELNKQITIEEMETFFGKRLEEIASMMLPQVEDAKRMDVLRECCREEQIYLREHGGALYPHLVETLSELKKKYFLAIVSNCQDGYVDAFFHHHKLREYFDDYEMSGRTGMTKGENIKLIIDRNSIVEALYVGDTTGDQRGALDADIPFIYAEYGFGNIDDSKYKISEFKDILEEARKLFDNEFKESSR